MWLHLRTDYDDGKLSDGLTLMIITDKSRVLCVRCIEILAGGNHNNNCDRDDDENRRRTNKPTSD